MDEIIAISLSVAAVALILGPAIYSAMLDYLPEANGKIRGGWLVSENGQPAVCRTTCHAPDMALYRENLKARRRGHGF